MDLLHIRRRNELLLASHSLVSAISLGKGRCPRIAHCVASDYLRAAHPSHIRHANIPAFLRAGALVGTVVSDAYRASQIPAAPSWDELVTVTAQPWQLDLVEVESIETLGSSEVTTVLDLLDQPHEPSYTAPEIKINSLYQITAHGLCAKRSRKEFSAVFSLPQHRHHRQLPKGLHARPVPDQGPEHYAS